MFLHQFNSISQSLRSPKIWVNKNDLNYAIIFLQQRLQVVLTTDHFDPHLFSPFWIAYFYAFAFNRILFSLYINSFFNLHFCCNRFYCVNERSLFNVWVICCCLKICKMPTDKKRIELNELDYEDIGFAMKRFRTLRVWQNSYFFNNCAMTLKNR